MNISLKKTIAQIDHCLMDSGEVNLAQHHRMYKLTLRLQSQLLSVIYDVEIFAKNGLFCYHFSETGRAWSCPEKAQGGTGFFASQVPFYDKITAFLGGFYTNGEKDDLSFVRRVLRGARGLPGLRPRGASEYGPPPL